MSPSSVSVPPALKCAYPNFFSHHCRRLQHARPSPKSIGGWARRVSEVLAPASIFKFQCLRRTSLQCAFCDPTVFSHHCRRLRHGPELPESLGRSAWRVSEVLAPASIFKFCGAHVCSAHFVTLECPFRHHQSALTPTFFFFFCIIAGASSMRAQAPRVF